MISSWIGVFSGSAKYSLDELKQFYIANFLEGDKWVGEMTNAEGEDAYKKWMKRQQSLTYIFENDILYLVDHFEDDKESIIKVYNGEHPNLLSLLMRDKVSIETVVIMNDILNFWPMWTEKIKEDIIWPIWQIQIEKYTPFVQYDKVVFKNLGFAVIDEQHKFGVAQRALLWKKNNIPPHVLVMTATPIPRTLALTAYGDLDYSVMDELPPGRKAIKTVHRFENNRPNVMDFIKEEIAKGRQAYIIYPLIEESSKLDYENLMKGYEEVKSFFPEPNYWVSMVHGKMKADQKETNMQRFVTNDTQIMVSTTVIEVGVNVPNASVMVIESAEKFGLSQLHQLRGRVGRGAEQSFCILLTGSKISKDAAERLKIMVATNDGFKIAEKDLEIRGPGDIEGTQQSGLLNFRLANIVQDKVIVDAAKEQVDSILDTDPDFTLAENLRIKNYLYLQKGKTIWSKIS